MGRRAQIYRIIEASCSLAGVLLEFQIPFTAQMFVGEMAGQTCRMQVMFDDIWIESTMHPSIINFKLDARKLCWIENRKDKRYFKDS